ncbi:MAG: serine/threonine protein kinase [Cyanothece sp. SIO1E1]|nr:serine/threonine protein kinase [Cyanothece sp. SIO1E1]
MRHDTQLGQICGSEQLFHSRYKVLRVLGRGGFGVTFLAKDVTLPGQPLCVIKQLCPKTENSISLYRAKGRFEREAKILSQLGSHAQIPMLLNYFDAEGEFYLVQEYIRGDNLAKEVRRSGRQSEAQVRQFLKEILPILQYIHDNNVIHRDVKPPNIIRCKDDNRLVLIDFGAVKEKLALAGESTQRASTTHFVGTVGFAPPEQLTLRAVYSSDIYALGVTCLYLLTGKPPLEFDYDPRSGEICWQDYVRISHNFAQILNKMLKTSHRDRYKRIEEIQRALDLEPHIEVLATCMNTLPHPSTASSDDLINSASYNSPTQRTAARIRELRSRIKRRHERKENKFVSGLIASTAF